ncbi:MAG: hypothetical protein HGA45_17475 [Chloroflexales bacterium]|nr:hypothetical protein [Chloroflexales bacterium]
MSEVSTFRLYVLRAMYAFMAIGLGVFKLPAMFNPPANLSTMGSVVLSVLAALALLAVLGIRYPLKILPLLFFEFLWKAVWVLAFALPQWSAGQLAPDAQEVLINNLVGIVLVPLAIPWGYVFNQYVKAPGDRWRKQMTSSTPKQPSASPPEAATGPQR